MQGGEIHTPHTKKKRGGNHLDKIGNMVVRMRMLNIILNETVQGDKIRNKVETTLAVITD